MKLALRMGRTVDELQRSMSGEEFSWWLALYQREPWDDWPGYYQAGVIASSVANYAGMRRAPNAPPAVPADYMGPYSRRGDGSLGEDVIDPDPFEHYSQITGHP